MYNLKHINISCERHVRDPIYKFIEIPDIFIPIIDDEIFQRLRWVSQLPLEQLVYPSAQHSRFEHCLGVMHLAIIAAMSLLHNSEDKMRKAFLKDEFFGEIEKDKSREEIYEAQKTQFILAAGLCGLLHDVGHAPFSHTLEDVGKYTLKNAQYDHEKTGFLLAKILLEKNRLADKIYSKTVLKVLNKENAALSLSPVQRILRLLIDGPIDVDKGDYLLRDSHHCGVIYGLYDHDRLWSEIAITENFSIGTTEKGALEAWSLRIARYKMFINVYKHHIRNITDALLIEIILDALSKGKKRIEKIMPITDTNSTISDNTLRAFMYWNDETLLKTISGFGDKNIETKITNFRNRKLFKRSFKPIHLSDYPGITEENERELIQKIMRFKITLLKRGIEFNFIVNKKILPPIFEEDVQSKEKGLAVILEEGETKTLAEFLQFGVSEDEIKKSSKTVEVFIRPGDQGNKVEIQKGIIEILSTYQPI